MYSGSQASSASSVGQRTWQLANLVVPEVDVAMEAGKLLENLPVLWEEEEADLTERRKLLMAMLGRLCRYHQREIRSGHPPQANFLPNL